MQNKKIYIGVCGWGDHYDLYPQGDRTKDKLSIYASHFPIVEIDSSFYAILPQKNYEAWVRDTPASFRFIVKPYQALTGHQRLTQNRELTGHQRLMQNEALTGHQRGELQVDREQLFHQFAESIQPLVSAGKLKTLLFQFPPWFDCTREHVQYVEHCRRFFADYPFAVEFRHRSWFEEQFREKTLEFLTALEATHVVCDEPQAGMGSVPIVSSVTEPKLSLVRFHGRNVSGWRDPGKGQNWRDVRYLYHYSDEELAEWLPRIEQLAQDAEEVCILFNNNSGGDAAGNAKRFMQMLGIEPNGLHPRQMELF